MSERKEESPVVKGSSVTWWGIGLSILAANIAYDYIHVGASMGYSKGLALGSYEWTGTLVMIFVLLFVFPIMMSIGVRTTPEYLGMRYGNFTRFFSALVMIFLHVFVVMVPVLYSASITLSKWFGLSYNLWLTLSVLIITGILLYKNLLLLMKINALLVIAMIFAGLFVVVYCFYIVGGIDQFALKGAPRINAFLPADDDMLPWHSVVFGGLWVAHAYYWSFNPFIQQFVLSSDTLSKAQFGFLLTATLKLLIPFIIMIPGVTLFILKGDQLADTELAFSIFVTEILPENISVFVLIAYLSTMIATFSSVGFSGINIVMNDVLPLINKKFINTNLSYRVILILFMLISFIGAYFFEPLGKAGLLHYNQVIMNAITPTIVLVFGLGLFFKRATALSANIALLTAIPLFLLMRFLFPKLDMLNTGGLTFLIQCVMMVMLSYLKPEKNPREITMIRAIRFERHLLVMTWSILLITFVLAIYVILM